MKPKSHFCNSFFSDTCISDPDLCATQSRFSYSGGLGLSVAFWLKITTADLRAATGDKDQQHQYIISSGGQVSNSRGFSFLYATEEQKFKLQLQTKKYVYMIEFDNLAETWVHIVFTWKVEGKWIKNFPYFWKLALSKICKNTGFHWAVISHIRTKSHGLAKLVFWHVLRSVNYGS